MYLVAALLTIALFFVVFMLMTAVLREHAGKLISVLERGELLRAIREEQEHKLARV